jgi:hypothetical protein
MPWADPLAEAQDSQLRREHAASDLMTFFKNSAGTASWFCQTAVRSIGLALVCTSILRGLAQCAKNQGVVVASVLKKFSIRFETFSLPMGFEGWHPSLVLSTHAQVSPSLRPINPFVQI